jgi:hypothetical protein
MNWRPWIIVGLLLAVFVVNGALMHYEEVDKPGEEAELVDVVTDDLANVPFAASTRLKNFKAFGLSDDDAELAVREAAAVDKRRERFKELVREYSDDVGRALCPSGGIPQRYAALSFLVQEKDGVRSVIPLDNITYFEIQDWYGNSLVETIYASVELEAPKKEASTAMAISAILLSRESDLIDGKPPWGSGMLSTWSITKVIDKYPEVERKLIQYFGLMHVLTEIANEPDGICS